MDALHPPHARIAAVFEWLVAALFLGATIAVAALILSQLRETRAPRSTILQEPAVMPIPASVPPGATLVPVLSLADGVEVKIGDTLGAVAARLGPVSERRREVDRGAAGERVTRFYEYGGRRFILVFEPPASGAEPAVTAIFVE